jgi:carbamate kinase
VEAVVDTDQVACILANELHAKILLMVIENDDKFVLSRLSTETNRHLSLQEVERLLEQETFEFNMVRAKLQASVKFLHGGGEQVIITTLRKLPATLARKSGLRIGNPDADLRFF